MSAENSGKNLERFVQLVLADRSLLEQLRQTADLKDFVALTVRLGEHRGCAFTGEDVQAALQEHSRDLQERWAWNG